MAPVARKSPTNQWVNMREPRTGPSGTLIADEHDQNMGNVPTSRRCMMNRNSVPLTIGAALFFTLFLVNGGHAFQIDRDQNVTIKQVSNTPIPCAGRTAVTCRTLSQPGPGAMATDGSRYTSHVSNTANPCGGRTGAACTMQRLQGSGTTATDWSRYTSASIVVPLPLVGILFGVGLIVLVGLGASRLRHHHEHHA